MISWDRKKLEYSTKDTDMSFLLGGGSCRLPHMQLKIFLKLTSNCINVVLFVC